MKLKTLIGAVAIIGGLSAHGAAANWDNGDGDIYAYGGSGAADGYVAYFFNTVALSQSDAITSLAAGDYSSVIAKGFESTVGLSDGGWLEDADVPADFTNGADGSAYLVVFNAATAAAGTYAYVSGVETEFVPGSGAPVSFTFDLSGSATASNWTALGGTGPIIPEPTSGLLLLLGLSGLALRRKHA